MNTTWKEQVHQALVTQFGQSQAEAITKKYFNKINEVYTQQTTPSVVVNDIQIMEGISESQPIDIQLEINKKNNELKIRLYKLNNRIDLSDVLPIFENMGLRAIRENPYEFLLSSGQSIWISEYIVNHTEQVIDDASSSNENFRKGFISIYNGICENDGFNKLILASGLTWREVMIIRAYSKYMHQARFRFSQQYIEKVLATYPILTKNLVLYFKLRHDTNYFPEIEKQTSQIEELIRNDLEKIKNLDDDRIIHRFWQLMKATVRSNYFQKDGQQEYKPYLSLKFKSSDIPELPLPHPLYEIFVYSAEFEGIHLRGTKVARGGIRWSDRREDFRTEILGLMKAQKVKNSVIVPSGAKGGFVLKKIKNNATREEVQEEVIHCYQQFIRGLLDLTDNFKNGKVCAPSEVRCYDDHDAYLVVAADKGTSTFSDIANTISNEYEFWLGDAFASGGSSGYDHKKLGITARGAWESIKRHFREFDIDIMNTSVNVVGIGDMSGDVFGNGATYCDKIKLVAAFDHRHIFLDPSPNPETSYKERLRLFKLSSSSWDDYNKNLISAGGGVYSRSLKNIKLSDEIKSLFAIEQDELPPNELIKALLRSPVDLIFNGGIGTYVKASTENHDEVGDKANEFCRVNAEELRCKVVGEGGNLGFTQQARIEFALNGGLINTDFIDNSAGVDCSDHEVNLKILLNKLVKQKKMREEERNELLASMSDEVANLVLKNNYNQALVMSFSSYHTAVYADLYQAHIKKLEAKAGLMRHVEHLPDDKKITERKSKGIGLTRPELAVLLAYTKICVKNEIVKSELFKDGYLAQYVASAFPAAIHQQFSLDLQKHDLNKEIFATQMSNLMLNTMGITFAFRLQDETGASIANVTRAFAIAHHIFDSKEMFAQVEKLDYKVPVKAQYELLHLERQLINMATRWFLRNARLNDKTEIIINHYHRNIKSLEEIIPKLIVGETKKNQLKLMKEFESLGMPTNVIKRFATSRVMYAALNIIEVATSHSFDLEKTAEVYFSCGSVFHLFWFRDYLAKDTREGLWNSLARLTLRDELDNIQRRLTIQIMQSQPVVANTQECILNWVKSHRMLFTRWEEVFSQMQSSQQYDFMMFFIAFKELNNLLDNESFIKSGLFDPVLDNLATNLKSQALVNPA